MDGEHERRVHLERLAVDAGERLARPRAHLEPLGRELVPVAAPVAPGRRRRRVTIAAASLPGVRGERDHPELAGVDAAAVA